MYVLLIPSLSPSGYPGIGHLGGSVWDVQAVQRCLQVLEALLVGWGELLPTETVMLCTSYLWTGTNCPFFDPKLLSFHSILKGEGRGRKGEGRGKGEGEGGGEGRGWCFAMSTKILFHDTHRLSV
jgi:hypothetical protein